MESLKVEPSSSPRVGLPASARGCTLLHAIPSSPPASSRSSPGAHGSSPLGRACAETSEVLPSPDSRGREALQRSAPEAPPQRKSESSAADSAARARDMDVAAAQVFAAGRRRDAKTEGGEDRKPNGASCCRLRRSSSGALSAVSRASSSLSSSSSRFRDNEAAGLHQRGEGASLQSVRKGGGGPVEANDPTSLSPDGIRRSSRLRHPGEGGDCRHASSAAASSPSPVSLSAPFRTSPRLLLPTCASPTASSPTSGVVTRSGGGGAGSPAIGLSGEGLSGKDGRGGGAAGMDSKRGLKPDRDASAAALRLEEKENMTRHAPSPSSRHEPHNTPRVVTSHLKTAAGPGSARCPFSALVPASPFSGERVAVTPQKFTPPAGLPGLQRGPRRARVGARFATCGGGTDVKAHEEESGQEESTDSEEDERLEGGRKRAASHRVEDAGKRTVRRRERDRGAVARRSSRLQSLEATRCGSEDGRAKGNLSAARALPVAPSRLFASLDAPLSFASSTDSSPCASSSSFSRHNTPRSAERGGEEMDATGDDGSIASRARSLRALSRQPREANPSSSDAAYTMLSRLRGRGDASAASAANENVASRPQLTRASGGGGLQQRPLAQRRGREKAAAASGGAERRGRGRAAEEEGREETEASSAGEEAEGADAAENDEEGTADSGVVLSGVENCAFEVVTVEEVARRRKKEVVRTQHLSASAQEEQDRLREILQQQFGKRGSFWGGCGWVPAPDSRGRGAASSPSASARRLAPPAASSHTWQPFIFCPYFGEDHRRVYRHRHPRLYKALLACVQEGVVHEGIQVIRLLDYRHPVRLVTPVEEDAYSLRYVGPRISGEHRERVIFGEYSGYVSSGEDLRVDHPQYCFQLKFHREAFRDPHLVRTSDEEEARVERADEGGAQAREGGCWTDWDVKDDDRKGGASPSSSALSVVTIPHDEMYAVDSTDTFNELSMVNHYQTVDLFGRRKFRINAEWQVVYVDAWPHIILTSIPGVPVEPGEELLADFGYTWFDQINAQCMRYCRRQLQALRLEHTLTPKALRRFLQEEEDEAFSTDQLCHLCYANEKLCRDAAERGGGCALEQRSSQTLEGEIEGEGAAGELSEEVAGGSTTGKNAGGQLEIRAERSEEAKEKKTPTKKGRGRKKKRKDAQVGHAESARGEREAEKTDDDEDDEKREKEERGIVCDGCNRAYHLECIHRSGDPPSDEYEWFCPLCILFAERVMETRHARKKEEEARSQVRAGTQRPSVEAAENRVTCAEAAREKRGPADAQDDDRRAGTSVDSEPRPLHANATSPAGTSAAAGSPASASVDALPSLSSACASALKRGGIYGSSHARSSVAENRLFPRLASSPASSSAALSSTALADFEFALGSAASSLSSVSSLPLASSEPLASSPPIADAPAGAATPARALLTREGPTRASSAETEGAAAQMPRSSLSPAPPPSPSLFSSSSYPIASPLSLPGLPRLQGEGALESQEAAAAAAACSPSWAFSALGSSSGALLPSPFSPPSRPSPALPPALGAGVRASPRVLKRRTEFSSVAEAFAAQARRIHARPSPSVTEMTAEQQRGKLTDVPTFPESPHLATLLPCRACRRRYGADANGVTCRVFKLHLAKNFSDPGEEPATETPLEICHDIIKAMRKVVIDYRRAELEAAGAEAAVPPEPADAGPPAGDGETSPRELRFPDLLSGENLLARMSGRTHRFVPLLGVYLGATKIERRLSSGVRVGKVAGLVKEGEHGAPKVVVEYENGGQETFAPKFFMTELLCQALRPRQHAGASPFDGLFRSDLVPYISREVRRHTRLMIPQSSLCPQEDDDGGVEDEQSEGGSAGLRSTFAAEFLEEVALTGSTSLAAAAFSVDRSVVDNFIAVEEDEDSCEEEEVEVPEAKQRGSKKAEESAREREREARIDKSIEDDWSALFCFLSSCLPALRVDSREKRTRRVYALNEAAIETLSLLPQRRKEAASGCPQGEDENLAHMPFLALLSSLSSACSSASFSLLGDRSGGGSGTPSSPSKRRRLLGLQNGGVEREKKAGAARERCEDDSSCDGEGGGGGWPKGWMGALLKAVEETPAAAGDGVPTSLWAGSRGVLPPLGLFLAPDEDLEWGDDEACAFPAAPARSSPLAVVARPRTTAVAAAVASAASALVAMTVRPKAAGGLKAEEEKAEKAQEAGSLFVALAADLSGRRREMEERTMRAWFGQPAAARVTTALLPRLYSAGRAAEDDEEGDEAEEDGEDGEGTRGGRGAGKGRGKGGLSTKHRTRGGGRGAAHLAADRMAKRRYAGSAESRGSSSAAPFSLSFPPAFPPADRSRPGAPRSPPTIAFPPPNELGGAEEIQRHGDRAASAASHKGGFSYSAGSLPYLQAAQYRTETAEREAASRGARGAADVPFATSVGRAWYEAASDAWVAEFVRENGRLGRKHFLCRKLGAERAERLAKIKARILLPADDGKPTSHHEFLLLQRHRQLKNLQREGEARLKRERRCAQGEETAGGLRDDDGDRGDFGGGGWGGAGKVGAFRGGRGGKGDEKRRRIGERRGAEEGSTATEESSEIGSLQGDKFPSRGDRVVEAYPYPPGGSSAHGASPELLGLHAFPASPYAQPEVADRRRPIAAIPSSGEVGYSPGSLSHRGETASFPEVSGRFVQAPAPLGGASTWPAPGPPSPGLPAFHTSQSFPPAHVSPPAVGAAGAAFACEDASAYAPAGVLPAVPRDAPPSPGFPPSSHGFRAGLPSGADAQTQLNHCSPAFFPSTSFPAAAASPAFTASSPVFTASSPPLGPFGYARASAPAGSPLESLLDEGHFAAAGSPAITFATQQSICVDALLALARCRASSAAAREAGGAASNSGSPWPRFNALFARLSERTMTPDRLAPFWEALHRLFLSVGFAVSSPADLPRIHGVVKTAVLRDAALGEEVARELDAALLRQNQATESNGTRVLSAAPPERELTCPGGGAAEEPRGEARADADAGSTSPPEAGASSAGGGAGKQQVAIAAAAGGLAPRSARGAEGESGGGVLLRERSGSGSSVRETTTHLFIDGEEDENATEDSPFPSTTSCASPPFLSASASSPLPLDSSKSPVLGALAETGGSGASCSPQTNSASSRLSSPRLATSVTPSLQRLPEAAPGWFSPRQSVEPFGAPACLLSPPTGSPTSRDLAGCSRSMATLSPPPGAALAAHDSAGEEEQNAGVSLSFVSFDDCHHQLPGAHAADAGVSPAPQQSLLSSSISSSPSKVISSLHPSASLSPASSLSFSSAPSSSVASSSPPLVAPLGLSVAEKNGQESAIPPPAAEVRQNGAIREPASRTPLQAAPAMRAEAAESVGAPETESREQAEARSVQA
ncbi:hypothetical protein BESB_066670 [Besnoitia besnoiti]|uniref:Zinc finger PHD-type domain-containing protein n=1 Tax=Besnoitia besnoiti TaxID=94643 RepID=A0A2A9MBN6_BESBE|nr:hypothetical protein BESB_066670 [Besnoitia besnoiti]PFH34634.1 hypothetical protein BESB_066670 [Besnoitia besnoiti]